MPNIKSAEKRMRTSEKARRHNFAVKSRIKTFRGQVRDAAAQKNAATLEAAVRQYASALDKAAKTRVIKKNTAIRRKRRAMAMLRALQAK
jgi:small subunit ribosomal protein S20